MGTCVAYIQLFCGWLLLNMATFSMVLVPHSVRILGFRANLDESDKFVVFGLWVLVEITVFFMLLVSATVIMCSCAKVPLGPGFIHVMVDPVFLALGCVPFILIKALPKVSAAHTCMYSPHSSYVYSEDNGHSHSHDPALQDGHRIRCLMDIFSDTGGNETMHFATQDIEQEFRNYLSSWVVLLQCTVAVPVLLKLVRFRWKMSWQPFLHSSIYFFLQAIDMALLLGLAVHTSQYWWNLAIQVFVYLNAPTLALASLGIATPPMYLGNHITNSYIKATTYIGTMTFDLPFLVLRLLVLRETWDAPLERPATVDGAFYLMLLKEAACLGGMLCILCQRVSRCVGSTYLSLNAHDSECEEYGMDEMDDFV